MSEIENLIADLQKQIVKLQEELSISEKNMKDFEDLAKEWMKSYNQEVPKLKIKIEHLEQTIEDLQEELPQNRL